MYPEVPLAEQIDAVNAGMSMLVALLLRTDRCLTRACADARTRGHAWGGDASH